MTDQIITALLEHIFQNKNMAGIGDTLGLRSSSTVGYFYFSLYETDPKEFSSELTYTGYARVAVPRTLTGFTVAGNRALNYGDVQFPERTDVGADVTATYFGIHYGISGEGNLFASNALSVPLVISTGVVPPYSPGSLIMEFNRV